MGAIEPVQGLAGWDAWRALGGMLAPALVAGLAASWLLTAWLRPRPRMPWRRPWAANVTELGIWLMAWAAELLLFGRPWFALANVLLIQLVIVMVSLAKYEVLREPFVFQDFEYFTDALRHPRLYLPFFPWPCAVVAAAGYGAALWLGLTLEPAIIYVDWMRGLAIIAALAALGWGCAAVAGRRLKVTFDAEADLRRLGLWAALWAYGRAESQACGHVGARGPFAAPASAVTTAPLPDLVSIQSESFFDARRVFPQIRADILQAYDRLRAEAVVHGELDVAARGANTVRTEFAFLAGLPAGALGVHRFNPYRKLARQGVPTIASYLRKLGYRTLCVHPYHGSFYGRDKVLPALGFDEFVDIRAFDENEKDGANIGDRALGGYVARRLRRGDSRPLYIHVITMENHGPLHLETVTAEDARALLNGPAVPDCEDLVAYARHLRNADAMLAGLRETLLELGRPAGLCVFGDHIPIMPKVYRALGEPSGSTDALIWVTGADTHDEKKLDVSALATTFLTSVGLFPSQ